MRPEVKWFHRDHGLLTSQEREAEDALIAAGLGFHVLTIASQHELENRLMGPVCGDPPMSEEAVVYVYRDGRNYGDRCVFGEPRITRQFTVIGLVLEDKICVYTAHGGPPAAQNPCEEGLSRAEIEASTKFWAEHALIK